MDRVNFTKIIDVLIGSYLGSYGPIKLAPNTMDVWYKILKDVPEKILESVVIKWVSTKEKFPTIADLRKFVKSISSNYLTAEEAWEKLLRNLKAGLYYTPLGPRISGDDIMSRAARSVGIEHINGNENNISFLKKQFIDAYENFSEKYNQQHFLTQPTRTEARSILKSIPSSQEKKIDSGAF